MNEGKVQQIQKAVEAKDCRLLPSLTLADLQEVLAALEARPPCACEGRTPIKDVRTDAIASGSIHGDGRYHINITLSTACKTISIPVHVLVFYAPPAEEKPCS